MSFVQYFYNFPPRFKCMSFSAEAFIREWVKWTSSKNRYYYDGAAETTGILMFAL